MARETHRKRKAVSARRARLLGIVGFRYSISRDAYVLRGIGNRFGPVYQIAARSQPTGVKVSDTPAGDDTEQVTVSS